MRASPPHRCVQAEFPHTALTWGSGVEAASRIPPNNFSQTMQDERRVCPALSLGRGLRHHVPLSRPPSLHHLRRPGCPRRCSAASQALRSRPTSHGRSCRPCGSSPSPTDPPHHLGVDTQGISRFLCKEFPRVRRVSDCARYSGSLLVTSPLVMLSASDNRVGTPERLISEF